MSNPTTGQIGQLVNLVDEKKTSKEVLDGLFKQGILADVLGTANPSIVDRDSLKKVLAGIRVEVKGFPIWKTLEIGGVSHDELLKKLADGGHRVSDYVRDIMGKPAFETAKKPTMLKLVRVQVKELRFTSEPTFPEICERAKQNELELCPAECGPHLRLSYTDQSMNEWNWIAMEPILDSDGSLRLFDVGRNADGSWLSGRWIDDVSRFFLGDILVFVSRK